MRARLFVRIMEHGRRIHQMYNYRDKMDFCDIAAIANNVQNHKNVVEIFKNRVDPQRSERKALKYAEENSAKILSSALRGHWSRIGVR